MNGLPSESYNAIKNGSHKDCRYVELVLGLTTSPHFSPGSRKQAQDSCSKAPLWSEKRSNDYGLSEEQAYGHED